MLEYYRFAHQKYPLNTAKTPWRTLKCALKLKYKEVHNTKYQSNNTDAENIGKGG
jgi:hypothetical protein